tara:strand:+ start:261 stop:923 length:663 start_codon:yes stop_codon:yes gene_type:complete
MRELSLLHTNLYFQGYFMDRKCYCFENGGGGGEAEFAGCRVIIPRCWFSLECWGKQLAAALEQTTGYKIVRTDKDFPSKFSRGRGHWGKMRDVPPAVETMQSRYHAVRDIVQAMPKTKRLRCPHCNRAYSAMDRERPDRVFGPEDEYDKHGRWYGTKSFAPKTDWLCSYKCDGPSYHRHATYVSTAEYHKKENQKKWLKKAKRSLRETRKLLKKTKRHGV